MATPKTSIKPHARATSSTGGRPGSPLLRSLGGRRFKFTLRVEGPRRKPPQNNSSPNPFLRPNPRTGDFNRHERLFPLFSSRLAYSFVPCLFRNGPPAAGGNGWVCSSPSLFPTLPYRASFYASRFFFGAVDLPMQSSQSIYRCNTMDCN